MYLWHDSNLFTSKFRRNIPKTKKVGKLSFNSFLFYVNVNVAKMSFHSKLQFLNPSMEQWCLVFMVQVFEIFVNVKFKKIKFNFFFIFCIFEYFDEILLHSRKFPPGAILFNVAQVFAAWFLSYRSLKMHGAVDHQNVHFEL